LVKEAERERISWWNSVFNFSYLIFLYTFFPWVTLSFEFVNRSFM